MLAATLVKALKMLVAVGFLLEWLRSEADAAPGTSHQLKSSLYSTASKGPLIFTYLCWTYPELGRIFEIVLETPRTGTKT